MKPARERLREAISADWEMASAIAKRAEVNPKAAGQMLAKIHRDSLGGRGRIIDRRRNYAGFWEYRR